jgi:hypothetical protein
MSAAPSISAASIARTFWSRRTWRGSPLKVAPRNAIEHSIRRLGPDDPRPERQHVHVVVLDALMRGIRVVADRRSDAAHLVDRDARADTRAADEDPTVRLTVLDRRPSRCAKSGSRRRDPTHPRRGRCTRDSAPHPQPADQRVLQRRSGVVGGEGDAHVRRIAPRPSLGGNRFVTAASGMATLATR